MCRFETAKPTHEGRERSRGVRHRRAQREDRGPFEPRPSEHPFHHMEADEATPTDEELWRAGLEPRVRAWGDGKGLHTLLCTLEDSFPHLFALAAAKAKANGDEKLWLPTEATEDECKRAYRRATLLLHPDRVQSRDMSVQIEAEEVLKLLTLAYADEDCWLNPPPPPNLRAASSMGTSSAGSPTAGGDATFGGTSLRDEIFASAPPPSHPSPRQAPPPFGSVSAPPAPPRSQGSSSTNPFGEGAPPVSISDSLSSFNPFDSVSEGNPFDDPPPSGGGPTALPSAGANGAGEPVLRAGYLLKQSGGKKGMSFGNISSRWEKRWCVLHKDRTGEYSLSWYKNEAAASVGPPAGAQGTIKVFESRIGAAGEGGGEHILAIAATDRVLSLKAASAEEERVWREALLAARKRDLGK